MIVNRFAIARAKKEKRTKKERKLRRGSLWKLPQPRKSFKVAFGNIFLMISSAAWKTLLGFPQLPQARRRYIHFKSTGDDNHLIQ